MALQKAEVLGRRLHAEAWMPIGGFLDGKHRPTKKEIETLLGKNAGLWSDLVKHISTAYGIPGVLSFGGPKYGWEVGFRKGGRPLADLYPADGFFVAQVVLGKAATSMAGQLRLGSHVREVFDGSRQLYDGRWLFIPVKSKRDVEDVKRLIDVKVTSK